MLRFTPEPDCVRMITFDELCREIAGLQAEALARWIANDWVRPAGGPGVYRFEAIDVARVRLIVTLRQEFSVDEDAVPVVLSLLDQLHDTRRHLHRLQAAIDTSVPMDAKEKIRAALRPVIVDAE